MSQKFPLKTSSIPWRVVDGRAVIVQPRAGSVHELNEVGTWLWSAADGRRSFVEIADDLCEEFELDSASDATRDLEDFYSRLSELGLMTIQDAVHVDT